MSRNVAAIICAAGKSSRFGGRRKKPFVEVAGRAVFLRSVELFAARDDVKQILVAIDPEEEEMAKIKWKAALGFHGAKFCLGGAERFETVAKALSLVREDIDLIAVHDAARCCLTKKWLDDVLTTAAEKGAAILACPVTATIKRLENETITQTVDRTSLYEAQTPQVFKTSLLKRAYANIDKIEKDRISDDSQLVEALGEKVAIVKTDASNIKITTKGDIAIAEAIIKSRPKPRPAGPVGPYTEAQW